ncbi:MocR-like pyridoxine biosynthesis transcription factor PdxR [Clostridium chauvoei]|uniref:PLP-dependent aminotransferase family protein n=2 Tax=Clostridium chauvoei TaxID=46867 RepID=A0ABD4RI03_9CLOT|nr:PLP-dependent aminotransferase family protein [Clostridium chauvoei]ATD55374.1 GntR family transcriptional regulator [Clostridium chauvoei]MBX7280799.1 PLP-dependent aminotransferase family protein [Clostridium chauvoei]MBX7283283.1 PLP-dependent aminotransferase family protein [Clostridium chauvoei]MBX7285833.1 PLP-dependent aminotransferase family protein [Clostridium chauvoei]MBX7288227.1 PLP-dependent aminotransferase family protein [Clostridium chauvoei]
MKFNFKISFIEEVPKYIQIANNIKRLIDNKEIQDGEKLPTIRTLALELDVNNVTIVNAYKKLKNEGYAYQKVGSGTYAKRKDILPTFNREYNKCFKRINQEQLESIIDFTGETSTQVYFPMDEFKSVINKVLDRDGANALIMKEPLGYEELRKTINKAFWNDSLNLDNILIVSGAQQGIDIASKAMLNINDNVIVEKPTYGGALSVFKWRRANIFEVKIKEDGIDIDEFEEVLKKNKIRCFYTMSYFHNPTGISYSRDKKLKLLELAEKYDFYIIEDDYLSELIYEDGHVHEPFKKLDKNDRVIYIKSFSKIFLPGIRLGYIITPDEFRENIQNSKINTDIATSSLMQRALELYIRDGFWKGHIAFQKEEYKKKYNLMKTLIEQHLLDKVNYTDPKGGINFYLELKDKSRTSKELFYLLKNKDVYITPGVIFFRYPSDGDYTFRIGFSQVDEEKIVKGIEIISKELK